MSPYNPPSSTQDAFYSRVSAAGVLEGAAALAAGGAPPRVVILDDGWQTTDVDEAYRAAVGGSSGTDHGGWVAADEAERRAAAARARAAEAAAELLAGPGDNAADTLERENALAEEAVAAAPPAPPAGALRDLAARLSELLARLSAAAFAGGRAFLDAQPSGSAVLRAFGWLARGPLRGLLLRFYAAASDHTRRLTSVEANAKFASPVAGPGAPLSAAGADLAAVVAALKAGPGGARHVLAWHALLGFWGGISPTAPAMAKYGAALLLPAPTPGLLAVDAPAAWVQPVLAGVNLPLDPAQLHLDMHAYLKSCGVDGVKVDVQGTVGLAGSAPGAGGGPALAATYHRSLEASIAEHFPGNAAINCMASLHSPLARGAPPPRTLADASS
jgi:raffinose synthase